jgi:hypothetical protein
MGKVIATGIYCGNRITVEVVVEDGTLVILMDEKEVPDLQKRFDELIKVQPAMGGTYFPDENSLLTAYNVLQYTFFDTLEEISVEGDIGEIPNEENIIY